MFEVTVKLEKNMWKYASNLIDLSVRIKREHREDVCYKQTCERDMFHSDFNYMMEVVANQIQSFIGNNPDEKV